MEARVERLPGRVGGTQRLLEKRTLTQGRKAGRTLEGGAGRAFPARGGAVGTPAAQAESQHQG